MSHLQYMPGDPRLVDQLVYELKSKGIFDQFRKECIADVDTRPAYQNLRQRVETSVANFLARQQWKPDLNKNQLREKLRKHILDANYLDQGVERIVDQVVNPKVATVFIPQVEDLIYNYLGIPRKKSIVPETSNGKTENDLLPTDLEAVSPGSVKSNEAKDEPMDTSPAEIHYTKMDIEDDSVPKPEVKEEIIKEGEDTELSGISDLTSHGSDSVDNSAIPLPPEIKPENIPPPENSPPKIEMPKDIDIPLPDEIPQMENNKYFKPLQLQSEDDDDSSSDSSLIRNMSPLTPVRNFDDENSGDAQQAFEDTSEVKSDEINNTPSSFKFSIENKSSDSNQDEPKVTPKKEIEHTSLSQTFEDKVNINTYNTPLYEDSSNSNNLHIDYESDANSKLNVVDKTESNHGDVKKENKSDEKKNSDKSSRRDSKRHSSNSKDRKSDSKHSSSRDGRDSKSDRKASKDDTRSSSKSKSSHRERSRDRSSKKDERRDSSRHHSSSHKSLNSKDSKSHRSSTSSQKHSSSKNDDKRTSSSSHRERSEKPSSKDSKSRDSKSSHRSDKDRKSSSSRKDEKDKDKKDKKDTDDHYHVSGRGNHRRSTDRDSNDGNSSSSKGSNIQQSSKSSETKPDKTSSSKETTSNSSDSTSPSDKDNVVNENTNQPNDVQQSKPVVRVDNLDMPITKGTRFMPEVILKKPRFASNFEEAKKMMKMRKFLDEEQRRMNQEAALLLEFQANVRPNLSQVYSSIPGPELEFACGNRVSDDNEPSEVKDTAEKESDLAETIFDIQKEIEEGSRIHDENIQKANESCNRSSDFEVTIITEEVSESEDMYLTEEYADNEINIAEININDVIGVPTDNYEETFENPESNDAELQFFDEQDKYVSEELRETFSKFLKRYTDNQPPSKLFLINCSAHQENIFKEASQTHGSYEVVSFHRNGHIKLPKATKHIDFTNKEISLPLESSPVKSISNSPIFSPVKSECSFELVSDYDAKLEDMVNTTSRQQIMEIILGGGMEGSPSKMPTIDICNESNIEDTDRGCKRKIEIEMENNNRHVLTPKKIRKTSGSDQISSTTEEVGGTNNRVRSKYLGKARRVGLPKPRRADPSNSPSSDKSVENYSQNTPAQKQPRSKVQRYDTSDLYKPKMHFLSRRHVS